jgi:hypothetical protein
MRVAAILAPLAALAVFGPGTDAGGAGAKPRRAAPAKVQGRKYVFDPSAAPANATASAVRANATLRAVAEKDGGAAKVTVDRAASGCVDFPGGRARSAHVAGTFEAPRPVGLVEFARYARQLGKAQPTLTLTSAWEAQIGPGRLLGESNGYHCVGCEHPLSRAWMLSSVKRRSLANFQAGKPFRRIVGCLREVTAKCTMFCYEWGVRESDETRNATDYRSKLAVPSALAAASPAHLGPFPAGEREPNTVVEYRMPPAPLDNGPPVVLSREYLEPGQSRDSLNNVMVNDCYCACQTTNSTMGADRPFACKCDCPPQHGIRGVQGSGGYAGERGPRGILGRVGGAGPAGLRGNVAQGSHRFATCGCYHENVVDRSAGNALLGCSKEGHTLAGLRPRSKGCRGNGANCIERLKCCRPCFKIEGVAPPKSRVTFGTKYTDRASEPSDGPDYFRATYAAAERLNGYCAGEIDVFRGFTNRARCHAGTLAGVDHEIMFHFAITFRPHTRKAWAVRLGGDYGRGAIILIDGKTWANRAGENLNWGGRFDSDSVVHGAPLHLEAFKEHKIEVYGIEGIGDGEQTMQVNWGEGWKDISPGAMDLGCK